MGLKHKRNRLGLWQEDGAGPGEGGPHGTDWTYVSHLSPEVLRSVDRSPFAMGSFRGQPEGSELELFPT